MELVIAFVLDFLFADPDWLPHPVVGMGKIIAAEYKLILKARDAWKKPLGIACALVNTAAKYLLIRVLLGLFSGPVNTVLSVYLLYTALAAKTLHNEAHDVKKPWPCLWKGEGSNCPESWEGTRRL